MENKAHALAAGAFVLVLLALLAALAAWLTRDGGKRDFYEISTPQTITGLQAQAGVRFRGVPVGKVESIGFDPIAKGHVLVRISVARGTPMTRSTFATINAQGVTGLGFVQLDDEAEASAPLPPNNVSPPRIPLRPGLVDKLARQSEALLAQAEQVAARLNELLSTDNPASVQVLVRRMGDAAGSVNQLVLALQPAAASLPELSRQSSQTLRSVQDAATGVRQGAAALGDTLQQLREPGGSLEKINESSAALSTTLELLGSATLPRLGEVADETARTMRQLRRVANTLEDNPRALIFGSGPLHPGPGEPGFSAKIDQP
jgi:phospholipid/cholesterol/gamma-HCH transport system substrate-binding protein